MHRSHSDEAPEEEEDGGTGAFELTAGLLQAKRVKDRVWAREAFASAGWILSPGVAALAGLLLILVNEIVLHSYSTVCVRPLASEWSRPRQLWLPPVWR